MPLHSKLLSGDSRLEACLANDTAHVTLGATGDHVAKIQTALLIVDGVSVNADELKTQLYGRSTAAAVLSYKTKRNIVNRAYQTTADNIVGKMTIASLDAEVALAEARIVDPNVVPHHRSFV